MLALAESTIEFSTNEIEYKSVWCFVYNIEAAWVTKFQSGTIITDVKIDIIYGTNGRPISFEVEWFEDGIKKTELYEN